MLVQPSYISLGANRSSSCSICSPDGLVAFAAGKFVALWDSENKDGRGLYETLPGHKGEVTTLKELPSKEGKTRFISADSIGEVRIWEQDSGPSFQCTTAFEAHASSSISAIGVPPASSSLKDHVLTGGSDGSVKLWKIAGGKEEMVQKLNPRGKLPLDMELAQLPGSDSCILVIGCTDRRIQIWRQQGSSFEYALSLEGHEDWIRCLSITPCPSASSSSTSDLLLASGAQDNYVRLWRISAITPQANGVNGSGDNDDEVLDMLDEFERTLAGETGSSTQLSTKAHVLSVDAPGGPMRYHISLEALLVGHESGLTNLHFSPPSSISPPVLLSSASDNSLIIWSPSSTEIHHTTDGIWIPSQRFGTLGGKGLAFYAALWGKEGKSVLASGWNGGWERWVDEGGRWETISGVSGHFDGVESVVWDENGDYLLSVGSDQTSRIHAPCAVEAEGSSSSPVWAEIARPQIHGYDMTSAAFISPFRFVSGADEKVVRIFDAPSGFVESLDGLGVKLSSLEKLDPTTMPKGATVPPLGLSNRALGKATVDLDMPSTHVQNQAQDSISQAFTSLPTEEQLSSSTLWPEIEKVYGHGYEIVSVASSNSGEYIATACKASNTEHAVVRVVSTSNWDRFGEVLKGHSLTITRIAFSPDDSMILTCSRDRSWRIFQRDSSGSENGKGTGFTPLAVEEKAHSRMVLDCCWFPDGKGFVTAGRDKAVKIWTCSDPSSAQWSCGGTIKLAEPATAVDITSNPVSENLVLAIGLESGAIEIYDISSGEEGNVSTTKLAVLHSAISHISTINRLAWRPRSQKLELASCSSDRSVRIFQISF